MSEPLDILEVVCHGNREALGFCKAFYDFLHLLDDLFDKDVEVTAERLGVVVVRAVTEFSSNPFFQRYRDLLVPSIQTAIVSWVDSESWKSRVDLREQVAAQVLKSQYHEVFYLVAGIVGGLGHQMQVTRMFRQYDWT